MDDDDDDDDDDGGGGDDNVCTRLTPHWPSPTPCAIAQLVTQAVHFPAHQTVGAQCININTADQRWTALSEKNMAGGSRAANLEKIPRL